MKKASGRQKGNFSAGTNQSSPREERRISDKKGQHGVDRNAGSKDNFGTGGIYDMGFALAGEKLRQAALGLDIVGTKRLHRRRHRGRKLRSTAIANCDEKLYLGTEEALAKAGEYPGWEISKATPNTWPTSWKE